nr:odorant receptor 20 [Graphosoma rubrolineatum]
MDFCSAPRSFLRKYVAAVIKDEPRGYVFTSCVTIRYGIAVMEMRKNEYLVVRYPLLMLFSITTILWILIDHILEFRDARWFTKILDYNYCGGSLLFAYTLKVKRAEITVFTQVLDQWWPYTFLDREQEELKDNLQRKLKKFNHFYNRFMVTMGIGFGLMPLGRYFSETKKSSTNLLLQRCWSPFPLDTWWGFSTTYWVELTSMLSLFYCWTYIVSFLITVMETIGKQLQLIGISLVTVEERFLKTMLLFKMTDKKERYELYAGMLQKELANSVKHYQKMQRMSEEACSVFSMPINICFSSGILAMVVSCAKLATERDNKFVIFQAVVMVVNVLVNQFIVSCINQILTDQMDNLRITIYDTPWYKFPIPCRKTIHMMQLMLLNPPAIRTVFGTKTDMEFFATVVNTSYFYLGALLSMNVKL